MQRLQLVIYGALAFLTGVLVSEFLGNMFLGEGVFVGRWVWMVSLMCVVLGVLCMRRVFVFGLVIFLCAGVTYFHGSFLSQDDVGGVKYYVGQEVEWRVRVDAEVDVRRIGQKLIVEVVDCGECMVSSLKGRALLNVSKYPVYSYGDVLSIRGFLEEPFETEDFSYKKYLERYGVYGVVKRPRVKVVRSEVNNPLYKGVFALKVRIQERINQLWSEPYASFESGLLLGARKGIPDYLMEAFNITGLTHIIAISGYNISLVIVLVGAAFSRFSRKKRVIMSFVFVVVFTILVGMSAAVVRAAIMGSIGLFALYFGRSTMVTLTLVMSALIMNIWNPKILPYDVGFQLSFAATCGIVYIAPRIERWFEWLPEAGGVREALQMTIAAQISTLPIILFHFGRLSIVSPLANVLVAPFIPLSMATGAIAFLLSLISDWFGLILAGITWVFLEIIIQLTLLCARVPFASIEVGDFDLFLVCCSYIIMWYFFSEKGTGN